MKREFEIRAGCIIEFLHSNQINIGSVLSTEKHITVITSNNRTIKLSKGRILPWSGPFVGEGCPREELLGTIEKLNVHRLDIKNNIDTGEVWSLLHEEVEECTIFWLAELLWEDPDVNQVAGLGRALIEDKLHFKFLNPGFKVFPKEVVESKLYQLNKEEREEKLIEKGREFFNILWEKRTNPKLQLPPLEEEVKKDLIELIKKGIASPENKSFQKKWKKLTEDIPQYLHLPVMLAETWRLIPKHYNYLLDEADYSWGDEWSKRYEDDILKIKEVFHASTTKVEDIPFISIDSASTRDIDDAFYVTGGADGEYVLYLAFAYPVLGWVFDSELDKEVRKRSSSLYLPEGTSHMLPEVLGTELFSLHAKKEKPALVLEIHMDSEANVLSYEIRSSWIRVDRNLTYREVENVLLEQGEGVLTKALHIARGLRENRIKRGAVIIEKSEPLIILTQEGDDYHIDLIQPALFPNSQLIVSEFMILANSIAARWAYEKDVPLLFRTQDISLPEESRGVWSDPVKTYGIIKLLSSTNVETTQRPHASIGVDGYAPITSPLRRYIDFINLAQIHRRLKGKQMWTQEDLNSILPYLNFRSQETAKIQKFRTRYWKLLYLKRYNKKKEWYALVVDKDPQCYTFVMPEEQLLIKVPKHLVRGEVLLGKRFRLWFNKIDPLNNIVKVQKAEEA